MPREEGPKLSTVDVEKSGGFDTSRLGIGHVMSNAKP